MKLLHVVQTSDAVDVVKKLKAEGSSSRSARVRAFAQVRAVRPLLGSLGDLYVVEANDRIQFAAEITSSEQTGTFPHIHLYSRETLDAENDEAFVQFVRELPIDWTHEREIYFCQLSNDVCKAMMRTLLADNMVSVHDLDADVSIIEKPVEQRSGSSTFDESQFSVDSLRTDEAEVVYESWKFSSESSLDHMRHTIEHGISSCIRLRSTAEPVAWCVLSHYGSIQCLYTKPAYRRAGLAKACVSDITNKLVAEGLSPRADVEAGNVGSLKMFLDLGWPKPDSEVYYWRFYKH